MLDRAGKRPFFLYVHYFDPHWYYNHHPQFDETSGYTGPLKSGEDIGEIRRLSASFSDADIAYLEGLYREEIAFTDDQIGKLLAHMQELGLADNTLVVLAADHGEEFRNRGWIGHTANLYDNLLHVPLHLLPARSPAAARRGRAGVAARRVAHPRRAHCQGGARAGAAAPR